MSKLSLIYHFQSSQSQDGDFQAARYRVVYFFGERGLLEKNLLMELAKSTPDADFHNLTFISLDDLKSFAMRVCQEVEAKDVRLISVQDYNIGLDGARDLKSFREIFERFGEVVINEEAKRKGFLGKFFS